MVRAIAGVVSVGQKFAVIENSVNQLSSNLDSAAAMLRSQGAAFRTAIEPLEGDWQGTSFGSWDQLTKAWDAAMTALNSALDSIKERVGNAGGLYDRYQSEQAAQLNSVAAGANWDATKFRN
jgi:WXG100 family type VII secretion target